MSKKNISYLHFRCFETSLDKKCLDFIRIRTRIVREVNDHYNSNTILLVLVRSATVKVTNSIIIHIFKKACAFHLPLGKGGVPTWYVSTMTIVQTKIGAIADQPTQVLIRGRTIR